MKNLQYILLIKWIVLSNILVKVSGTTNVNKFSCEINTYPSRDTLLCYLKGATDAVRLLGKLEMPVNSFNCQDRIMTHDLRETLKARQHPYLRIALLSLQKYPSLTTSPEQICGIVSIELAGVTKEMMINLAVSTEDQKMIHMRGSKNLRFSDFGLIPPKKFGGMIRAKDELDVSFNFNFKIID